LMQYLSRQYISSVQMYSTSMMGVLY